jgi:hypothetical protein
VIFSTTYIKFSLLIVCIAFQHMIANFRLGF